MILPGRYLAGFPGFPRFPTLSTVLSTYNTPATFRDASASPTLVRWRLLMHQSRVQQATLVQTHAERRHTLAKEPSRHARFAVRDAPNATIGSPPAPSASKLALSASNPPLTYPASIRRVSKSSSSLVSSRVRWRSVSLLLRPWGASWRLLGPRQPSISTTLPLRRFLT